MKKLPILSLVICAVAAANAASEPVQIETKTKSSFTAEKNGRNMFWPIGWRPSTKAAADPTEHVTSDIPVSAFVVTSITFDNGTKFAIINGKPMQEGQVFGLQMGNQTYQLSVKRIEDGRVIFGRRDQELVVPLRRH